MIDELPKKCKLNECGIVNLASSATSGTHWVCYYKTKDHVHYFDSFGDLKPPQKIIEYLGENIYYNYPRFQSYPEVICGHLCLQYIYLCHKIFSEKKL